MSNEQIKFYVTPEEKLQIQKRAEERYLKAPTFAKLSALGVELVAPEKIYVPSEPVEVIKEIEVIKSVLTDADRAFLNKLVHTISDTGYVPNLTMDLLKDIKILATRLLENDK